MLTLLGGKPSPFVRKVIVALEEKGVPYQIENLSPFPKTPELLAQNPLGKIPILRDGSTHIPDSSVIIAYLERIHPKPSIYPEDPKEFARALFLEEFSDSRVAEVCGGLLFQKFIKPNFFKQETDQAVVDGILKNGLPSLVEQLEGFIAKGATTLLSRFSVADAALGCQLQSLVLAGVELDAKKAPKLVAYRDAIHGRPSFKAAMPSV